MEWALLLDSLQATSAPSVALHCADCLKSTASAHAQTRSCSVTATPRLCCWGTYLGGLHHCTARTIYHVSRVFQDDDVSRIKPAAAHFPACGAQGLSWFRAVWPTIQCNDCAGESVYTGNSAQTASLAEFRLRQPTGCAVLQSVQTACHTSCSSRHVSTLCVGVDFAAPAHPVTRKLTKEHLVRAPAPPGLLLVLCVGTPCRQTRQMLAHTSLVGYARIEKRSMY